MEIPSPYDGVTLQNRNIVLLVIDPIGGRTTSPNYFRYVFNN